MKLRKKQKIKKPVRHRVEVFLAESAYARMRYHVLSRKLAGEQVTQSEFVEEAICGYLDDKVDTTEIGV